MPYRYRVDKKDDYIFFDVRGEADTVEDSRWFANEAIKEAERLDCDCLFFDERHLSMNLTSHDVYVLAEEFSQLLLHSGLRVAAFHVADNSDVGGAFETMLRNRSFNYRSFTDKDEALDWLVLKADS